MNVNSASEKFDNKEKDERTREILTIKRSVNEDIDAPKVSLMDYHKVYYPPYHELYSDKNK